MTNKWITKTDKSLKNVISAQHWFARHFCRRAPLVVVFKEHMEPSSRLSSITLKIGKNGLEGHFYKKMFTKHLIAYISDSLKNSK
jgi:hypothetical protein